MLEKIVNQVIVHYLFETDSDSIKTYYKMKHKNGYAFTEEERASFINIVTIALSTYLLANPCDILLVPETDNPLFLAILRQMNTRVIILKKRQKAQILEELANQKMMKAEKSKLLTAIQHMPKVKIGLVAANQRQRVASVLFEDTHIPGHLKVCYFDDSVFTGSTLAAVSARIKLDGAVVLFSNQ